VHRTRIAHLDHTSAPGGAQYALERMLEAGVPWQPALVVPPGATDGVFTPLRGRIPIRRGGVPQPPGVSSGSWSALLGAATRLAVQAAVTRVDRAFRTADLIDANTARSAAYGALAARTSRVPFVIHLRDFVEAESLGRSGFAMMSRLALPRADGVVANSRATLASARPYLRSDAATAVIPSASGLLPRTARRERQDGPLRIGMLARIDPWKGQLLLLESFAEAFGEGDAQLEFAGGAPFGHDEFVEEIRARAGELGVGDRVHLLGHIADVRPTLERWDIAVQASIRPEPLGQNVLQYLAAGLPTVVAGEGGPTEWVEDGRNGIVVQPRDPAALGAALRRLAQDSALRERMSAEAPVTPGLLSDADVVHAHMDFYEELLRGA
jgi:glycosyltransferase involved in cell wall biosynthesis